MPLVDRLTVTELTKQPAIGQRGEETTGFFDPEAPEIECPILANPRIAIHPSRAGKDEIGRPIPVVDKGNGVCRVTDKERAMKNGVLGVLTGAGMMLIAGAAIAGGGYTSGVVGHAQTDWHQEAFYDGCMNGDVSSTGLFSSQVEEDKARARMAIAAHPAS